MAFEIVTLLALVAAQNVPLATSYVAANCASSGTWCSSPAEWWSGVFVLLTILYTSVFALTWR